MARKPPNDAVAVARIKSSFGHGRRSFWEKRGVPCNHVELVTGERGKEVAFKVLDVESGHDGVPRRTVDCVEIDIDRRHFCALPRGKKPNDSGTRPHIEEALPFQVQRFHVPPENQTAAEIFGDPDLPGAP